MGIADKYFAKAAKKIFKHGFSDNNYQVRPKWPDGVPAHTKKIFCFICEYDLEKEFPALTLRKQSFNNCIKELLWMWQKKSNIVSELECHNIWDAWKLKDGTIGKTYGYQLGVKYNFQEGYMDQVDALLYNLKHNPMNRRMIVTMWNPKDIKDMALPPCVYETIWDVSNGKLNMTLIQRSGDMLAAAAPGGWDCCQYAILQSIIAQVCGYKVGKFVHIINNLHIYDRHEKIIKSILKNKKYKSPKLWINPNIKDFYDFTSEDIKIFNYKATKLKEKFEVAE